MWGSRFGAILSAFLSFSAVSGSSYEVVYVGSAVCRGSCPDDTYDWIYGIAVKDDGELTLLPNVQLKIGSNAGWLTARASVQGSDCLYASLINDGEIVGIKLSSTGEMTANVKLSSGNIPTESVLSLDSSVLYSVNLGSSDVKTFLTEADCDLTAAGTVDFANTVHGATPTADGRVFVVERDGNKIVTFDTAADGTMTQVAELSLDSTQSDCAPRHAKQHPTLELLYVNCEAVARVVVLSIASDGTLAVEQNVETQSADYISCSRCGPAEILVEPAGKAVYVSNRASGAPSVSVLTADSSTGHLTLANMIAVPESPLGMALAHGGSLLLVVGQTNADMKSYSVGSDGMLAETGFGLAAGVLPPNAGGIAVIAGLSPDLGDGTTDDDGSSNDDSASATTTTSTEASDDPSVPSDDATTTTMTTTTSSANAAVDASGARHKAPGVRGLMSRLCVLTTVAMAALAAGLT